MSGERPFQHELPCDAPSLVRWCQRIGEEGCEWLLEHSIQPALAAGVVKPQSLSVAEVDTTVQPNVIAHPTDSRLLKMAHEQLVDAAQAAGIELRQSPMRVGKAADAKAGRYAHAQQLRRMRRGVKRPRTWLGRVIRDVQRKAGQVSGVLKTRIETAQRLYEQRRDSKNKLYALHAPEVECIAAGKARTPYEFGVKNSVAVTARKGSEVGMRSMPGAPYDGHTQHSQLQQVEILTGVRPSMALADRGYRGVPPPEGVKLLLSHTRGLPKALKKLPKRRQAIEPTIAHMKTEGLLARNWLKGTEGDAIHAVLCGAGRNIWLIMAHLRVLLLFCLCLLWHPAKNTVPCHLKQRSHLAIGR